jgi:hypothetical protein
MAKEFQQCADPVIEPGASAMGASVIDYGEQREVGYADPGSEGAKALAAQKGNGGIGSSGSYPEGTSDGITGA